MFSASTDFNCNEKSDNFQGAMASTGLDDLTSSDDLMDERLSPCQPIPQETLVSSREHDIKYI